MKLGVTGGGYNTLSRFVINKSKRLLLPYIIVSTLWVIPIEFCFKEIKIVNYALAISPSQLWFLIMLFGVFMIVYPITNIIRKNPIPAIIIFTFLFFAGSVIDKFMPNIFQVHNILKFSIFFVLGFITRLYAISLSDTALISLGFMCLGLNLTTYFFLQDFPLIPGLVGSISRISCSYFCSVSGVIMSFTLLLLIARHLNWANNKLFTNLAELSFYIYLIHQQIIYFSIILLNGLIRPEIHVLANFFASIGISYFMIFIFSMIRKRITSFDIMLRPKHYNNIR